MANTNTQAVSFDNNFARRMADLLAQTYYSAKALVNFWNAQSLSTVIPNDATLIIDGAATDGRPIATDAQVTSIVTRCQEFVTDYEAGSSAKLNTVLAIAVHGSSIF